LTAPARVCLIDLRAIGDAELAGYLRWLGPTEAARHQRFVRPQRRRQFLAGRVLLRRMLGQLLAMSPNQIELIEQPGQAPLLDCAQANPGFSLSHSGPWVGCAVSAETGLGLDIEVVNLERDIDALAEQAFSAANVASLKRLPMAARAPAFYRMWTEQEALCKLGPCEQASCISLQHPTLSIVPVASSCAQPLSISLASAQPLSAIPLVELVVLAARSLIPSPSPASGRRELVYVKSP
jgi:4'-phosphopantetheinyl transferase